MDEWRFAPRSGSEFRSAADNKSVLGEAMWSEIRAATSTRPHGMTQTLLAFRVMVKVADVSLYIVAIESCSNLDRKQHCF